MRTQPPLVASLLVKFGGSVAGGAAGDPVLADVVRLAADGVAVALVHGGGPAVDAELRRRGIATVRVGGLRVTDAATLEIVEQVLGREVNASIVAALAAAGGRPERVAGDDGVFVARRLSHPGGDLGFVGEVEAIDAGRVAAVLERGGVPVISPIGADRAGQRFNINADTAAGALAAALQVAAFVAVTDVERVRRDRHDPGSGIARLTVAQVQAAIAAGMFVDGMLPKMQAVLAAVQAGVPRAFICGAGPGAISAALRGAGTEVIP